MDPLWQGAGPQRLCKRIVGSADADCSLFPAPCRKWLATRRRPLQTVAAGFNSLEREKQVDERDRTRAAVIGRFRSAGILYLLIALIGPVGLVYVPNKLFVLNDAAATAVAVRGAEWLLRTGIACDLLHQTLEVFLVVELYRLFAPVSRRLAQQMAALGFIPIPIAFFNTVNPLAVIVVLSGPAFLASFTEPQLQSLAYLFVRLHSLGMAVASVFWGLWLVPLGILTFRSGWAPRAIGILTGIAGLGYLLDAFARIVVPSWREAVMVVAVPLQTLELVFIVWILIAGFWRRNAG